MRSVLSYWRDYFDPRGQAPMDNSSTGLIARHLHELLSELGPVDYYDHAEIPAGLEADLFVGHFWSFADVCRRNSFRAKVAVYVLCDPVRARALLQEAAARHGLPMPEWDLPPAAFDHEATMEHADVVLLTGNRHTLETFPERWRPKIRLLNYGLDERLWADLPIPALERTRPEFVFVATHCGLRKGFLDVLATWREIQPDEARLHVIGRLEPPYDRLLEEANTGSMAAHGWVDSRSARYRELLGSCRFAYIPTWVEGQMGTLLEAVFAGCIPITTSASGAHQEVLRHCVMVEPGRPEQHRAAIREVLTWSARACAARRDRLLKAARRRQNWNVFCVTVRQAIKPLLRETAGTSCPWP